MVRTAIGRYQILGDLGAGGFGVVYRAYDPNLDREIALKVVHSHLARNPSIRQQFIREGRSLARVHHPHLVQVHDAGETADGQVYLAMQLVPGRTLDELAQGRTLVLADLAPLVVQIAAALDAIHAAGLVHRDIKPANILVTDTGQAVLLDMGIARDVQGGTATQSGLIKGTPGYLAPEQVDNALAISPRTDVYQLGATVYALLAGQPPFLGDTAQVLFNVVHRAPADLGDLRPDLSPHGVAAIAAAMAKDPARRPSTAGEFAAALTAGIPPEATQVNTGARTWSAAPASAAPTQTAPAGEGPQRSRALRRPVVLAGAGVLAVALLFGAAFAFRGGDGDSSQQQVQAATGQAAALATSNPSAASLAMQATTAPQGSSERPLEVALPRELRYESLAVKLVRGGMTSQVPGERTRPGHIFAVLELNIRNLRDGSPIFSYANAKLRLGDGTLIGSNNSGAEILRAREDKDIRIIYWVPADATWKDSALLIGPDTKEQAVIPLDGPMPPVQFPAKLPTGARTELGGVAFQLVAGEVDVNHNGERAGKGERYVRLTLQVSNNQRMTYTVSGSLFRVLVDGVARAPSFYEYGSVPASSVGEFELLFMVAANASTTELQIGDVTKGEAVKIPLDVKGAKP